MAVIVTDEDLDLYLAESLALVKQAGVVINEKIHQDKEIAEKLSRTDLVTETDKAIEDLLCNGLK